MKNLLPQTDPFSFIRLRGDGASDFCHRLFSVDVQSLKMGEPSPSLLLTAEAKIGALFWVVKREGEILLFTPTRQLEKLHQLLNFYYFNEPFKIEKGGEVISFWSSLQEPCGPEKEKSSNGFRGIWKNTLFEWRILEKPQKVSEMDILWEKHRLLNLIPRYLDDYQDNTFAFEIGLENLCASDKGCYIGQEVMERMRTRGGEAPQKLVLCQWESPVQPLHKIWNVEGEEMGCITRSVFSAEDEYLSFAFIKRKFLKESNLWTQNKEISGRRLRVC